MGLEKQRHLEERIRKAIDGKRKESDELIISFEKTFNETKILSSGFFERQCYSAKHWVLNRVSKSYRDAEGYKAYESWRKKVLSTPLP